MYILSTQITYKIITQNLALPSKITKQMQTFGFPKFFLLLLVMEVGEKTSNSAGHTAYLVFHVAYSMGDAKPELLDFHKYSCHKHMYVSMYACMYVYSHVKKKGHPL